eukprot:4761361-Prymnesium_polylepis.1
MDTDTLDSLTEGGVASTSSLASEAMDAAENNSTSQVSVSERTGEYGTHPNAHGVSLTAVTSLLHSQANGSEAPEAVRSSQADHVPISQMNVCVERMEPDPLTLLL